MCWLFYFILQVFIWNYAFRDLLFPGNPAVHLIAELMNDMFYIPVALFLPIAVVSTLYPSSVPKKKILIGIFISVWIALNFEYGLLRPLIFFIFIFAAVLFFTRRRSLSRSRIGYLLCLIATMMHYRFQLLPPFKTSISSLTAMSFNMNTRVFAYNDERTVRLIREQLPDIVFLQECHRVKIRNLVSRLNDLYPYQCGPGRFRGHGDVLILSRYPLTILEPIVLRSAKNNRGRLVNHAVVQLAGRNVRLINCHLTHSGKELQHWLFGGFRREDWIRLLAAYYGQQEEFSQLIDFIGRIDGPLILAGDFNEAPNGKHITYISKRLVNTFGVAGWGVGATYGGYPLQRKLPKALGSFAVDYLRIDHLFCSHHFRVESAQVYSVGAFDHRPLIIRLSWRESK